MTYSTTQTFIIWIARIISVIYVGFFLFMFIGETLPLFNNGQVQHFSSKDILLLSLLGIYLLSLLFALKWNIAFGIVSLFLLAIFISITKTWRAPYFLIGFIPSILYIISYLLARKK